MIPQTISRAALLVILPLVLMLSSSTSAQTNLIPNGDFGSGSTSWTIPASASTSGGYLTMQPTYTQSSYRATSSTIAVTTGRYRFSFYYNATVGQFRVFISRARITSSCDGICSGLSLSIPQTPPASWNTPSGYVSLDVYIDAGNTYITFEPITLTSTFIIDNVSLSCLVCDPATPNPSYTPPPSQTPRPGYVTTTPRPNNPNPPPGCLIECGAIPLPLPNMPGLLSPTPMGSGNIPATATSYLPPEGNGYTATPIIEGLGSELDDLEGVTTATAVGPQAPGGDDIGIETTFDLVDDTALWIAYIKGFFETNAFGPFQPIVNLFLVVLLVAIAYLMFSFLLPLAAAFVGLTRKLYTAIMDALPL